MGKPIRSFPRSLLASLCMILPLPSMDGPGLESAVAGLAAGETLLIPDGSYPDVVLRLSAGGTPNRPTVLAARNPGKVRIIGSSALIVKASDVVVSGLRFEEGGVAKGLKNLLEVAGDRVRVHGCSFQDMNRSGGKQWLRFTGVSNAFESNFVAGKTTVDPSLQVEVEEHRPNHMLIRGNHFGHRPPLGQNGGETIRIGYSHQSAWEAGTRVVENLFERCDGEVEVISCKACGVFFHSNTFLHCAGALTLRHGNGSEVFANVFLGGGAKDSAGVRVIGAGHRIENNHFEGLTKDLCALSLTASQPDFALSGYWTVTNVLFRSNTVGRCATASVHFSAMFGGKGGSQSVLPSRCDFEDNVFMPGVPGFAGTPGEGHRFRGNRVGSIPAGFPPAPGLVEGEVPFAARAFGPARPAGYASLRVLTPSDAGPEWMRPTGQAPR